MMSEDEQEELYCLCRSSDISRFMIMCDNCEEWYHGDCINLDEEESKHIKYYFCKSCRSKDPFLKIKYRKSRRKSRDQEKKKKLKKRKLVIEKDSLKNEESSKPKKLKKEKSFSKLDQHVEKKSMLEYDFPNSPKEMKPSKVETHVPNKNTCGKCSNCRRTVDCKICDVCRRKQDGDATNDVCLLRGCLNLPDEKKSPAAESDNEMKLKDPVIKLPKHESDKDEDYVPKSFSKKSSKSKPVPIIHHEPEFKVKKRKVRGHSKKKNKLKPCLGPGCRMYSRRDSKYCSDDCGRNLAAERLYKILPSRINEWRSTPCVANDIGRTNLERIRKDMQQAREELSGLEMQFNRLESIIVRGKSFSTDASTSMEDDEGDDDYPIYCVVCGHSVPLRTAVKHMDRCYIKIESQMSFGSVFPTRIEGSQRLFCDTYNAQQQTYCKRLQVLCPEHTKEAKIGPNEVCGCPLSTNIYKGDEPAKPNQFCRIGKRKCTKHYKWETMYRAEIDLARIRQWLKIDEIFEEERKVRAAMSARGNVIGVLLHQTVVHDPICTDMRTRPSDVKRPAYRFSI